MDLNFSMETIAATREDNNGDDKDDDDDDDDDNVDEIQYSFILNPFMESFNIYHVDEDINNEKMSLALNNQ